MAMERLPPPAKLDFNSKSGSNLSDDWKKWKEEFSLYSDLALKDEAETGKLKLFKYLIGQQGREIYSTQRWADEEKDRTLKTVLDAFDKYCQPKKNETVERFKFNMRAQGDETLEKFITDVKTLSKTCSLGELTDSLVRDKIVCGIKDHHLRERLLRTTDLTLDKAEEMCRASEVTKQSVNTLEQAASESTVHAITRKKRQNVTRTTSVSTSKPKHKGQHYTSQYNHKTSSQQSTPRPCKFCGKVHEHLKEKCPAYGQTCRKCHRPNHFEVKCPNGQKSSKTKQVHLVDDNNDFTYYDLLSVDLDKQHTEDYNVNTVSKHELYATVNIGEKNIRFQLDSGAMCNIIPLKLLPKSVELKPTTSVLRMLNKSTVIPLGTCQLEVTNPKNSKQYTAKFVVVKDDCTPLIGSQLVQEMELIQVNYKNILTVQAKKQNKALTLEDISKKYGDVFEGNGHFKEKYHLSIDPEVPPVVHPPRKVPIALKGKLKEELDRLESIGIITTVTEPTPWVSSLVMVVKPEKVRICIDPKDLNKALKRSHYPLPTIEDVLPDLHRAKVFSVLDARNGFWHVELDRDSSLHTTFNTPFGRYRWLRMPFGLSTAPEEYQRRQDQAVEGLPGVKSIVDDILVYGEGDSEEEAIRDHDTKLESLLQRCREKGLKLNKDKLKLRQKEVRFIGHLITAEGLKPDPEKVQAVVDMPEPTDVSGVRRFIGFVNYLGKFLPGLSDKCEPLRKLTLQDVEWHWTQVHSDAVNEIKKLITSKPVLRYYDPKEELTLQCDASEKGLRGALLQKGQPIAFATQIEKELLVVVFGLEKFHQYVYGRSSAITVLSDHKPLEMIIKKSLHAAPKRLQRMLLRLQRYNINIEYHPGRLMYLADTLSRAYLKDAQHDTSDFHEDVESINMAEFLPIEETRLNKIKVGTASDVDLQVLMRVILEGWPDQVSSTPRAAQPYFNVRDELTVQNGIIFRGERAVIPLSLRPELITRIHSSHLGIEGCLRRAREAVYWPNMNSEVREYIEQCDTCRKYERSQSKETLISHKVPDRPWAKLGCDLFTFDQKEYLITVDYYSNYFEIDYLRDTKSATVVRALRAQFARHGIPDLVVSDNGPQFSSEEFRTFSREWGFEHVTSSPGYAQSNGKAEQAVQTAKRLMLKAKASKSDPFLALLDFRNTPTQSMDSSPVQRLMNRRTKTLLPTKRTLLKPEIPRSIPRQLKDAKDRQAYYYNIGAKDMTPLKSGDTVRVAPSQGHNIWRKATVQEEVAQRSYKVRTDDGRVYRRNRRHLRASKESGEQPIPVMDDIPRPAVHAPVDPEFEPSAVQTPASPPKGPPDISPQPLVVTRSFS